MDEVSFTDALVQGLGVMDAAAMSLGRDNNLTMRVFGMDEEGNVTRALVGEEIGTAVTAD
jgi:uridylate kinase